MVALVQQAHPDRSDTSPLALTLDEVQVAERDLRRWLFSAKTQALPLHEIEVEQERRSREVQRLLLQAHVETRGVGDVGPTIGRRQGAVELRLGQRSLHGSRFVSIFGAVEVERLGYHRRRGRSIHPLDEDLALPKRSYSQEVQRRVIKAAVQGPYDEAVERLEGSTGVTMPKRSAEAIVADAAVDVDRFYVERRLPPPSGTGPILVGSVDGKGIPMCKLEPVVKVVRRKKGEKPNKKRMATVGAVYTRARRVRTPEEVVESLFRTGPRPEGRSRAPRTKPEHKRVFASLKQSKDEVIAEVAAEMDRRDPRQRKERVCVTDGEKALQKRVRTQMPNVTLVLDFLHALEYLWKAAYVFHAEGSQQAEDWVKKRALWLLEGRSGQVVKGLRQSMTKRRLQGQDKKTLTTVSGYLHRNRLRMRYDKYLAAGLPIASGAVEGACKNVIKDRMERSGMRWSEDGAEAMVKLRATYLSGDFEEFWAFHVRAEQERLHPPGLWRPLEASA